MYMYLWPNISLMSIVYQVVSCKMVHAWTKSRLFENIPFKFLFSLQTPQRFQSII